MITNREDSTVSFSRNNSKLILETLLVTKQQLNGQKSRFKSIMLISFNCFIELLMFLTRGLLG